MLMAKLKISTMNIIFIDEFAMTTVTRNCRHSNFLFLKKLLEMILPGKSDVLESCSRKISR